MAAAKPQGKKKKENPQSGQKRGGKKNTAKGRKEKRENLKKDFGIK